MLGIAGGLLAIVVVVAAVIAIPILTHRDQGTSTQEDTGEAWPTEVTASGDDGREQSYRAVDRGGMLRAKTAKGVKARHWTTRLEIVDATELELDRIEWLMPISARRV